MTIKSDIVNDRLKKAQEAARAKREAGELVRLDPLEKAAKNPNSLRMAINGKCYDCVGRDADPGWRDRVRTCQIFDCPLHNVRQFK